MSSIPQLQPLITVNKLQLCIAVMTALQTALLPSRLILYLNALFHIFCPRYHPLNKSQSYFHSSQSIPLRVSLDLQLLTIITLVTIILQIKTDRVIIARKHVTVMFPFSHASKYKKKK